MSLKAFFQIEEIEFFSKRIKNNQAYRNNEIQDLGDSQRIIEGIYNKTTKWGEGVKKRYQKLFHFEPDNRWQISGNFKKYSWGRLYLNQHGNQEIYYTIGVDSELKALLIKIDFDRVKSKVLTKYWLNYFDNLLKANNVERRIIEIDELKGKDERWLIDETCRYINATLHVYKELHRVLFHKILEQSDSTMEITESEQPLNQILYGPPGTGKTYSTIELAYRAIKGDAAFEQDGYEMAKQWFKNELAKSEDRQLDFITFHQNYSYEDFVMGIKPDLNEGDGLSFNRHEGIFFKICQRALKNYEDSQKPIEVIEQEKGLEELFDSFKNSVAETLEDNGLYSISDAVNIVEVRDDAFVYLGHNWNHNTKGIQMKFRDIILLYNDENAKDRKSALLNTEISGLAKQHISWYFTMVKKFRSFVDSQKLPSTITTKKISLKNYVIIIDEINRANISRVFGELITLIEEDKRWGNDHAMEVRLPDGHTKFTVPKNLYIIGTMNTADKSIALLDIALRRRFEFTALYPDSSKVSPKCKTFFESLNEQIIAKKGIDFTIGHSYFMTKNGEELDFVKTLNKKVIPLLSEYFYNAKDNTIVAGLLKKAITDANFSHTIVSSAYQLLIQ